MKRRNFETVSRCPAPKAEQQERCRRIREKAGELAELIGGVCPESWERSLAGTKLKEAVMWACASITRNG